MWKLWVVVVVLGIITLGHYDRIASLEREVRQTKVANCRADEVRWNPSDCAVFRLDAAAKGWEVH